MGIRLVEAATVSDKIADAEGLLVEHWRELALNKDLMVLSPDVGGYKRMEEAGVLFALLAYDDDVIVGYSVNFLTTNLHYSALVYSQNDLLFVAKEHRGGRLGYRLIKATEDAARNHGAKLHLWHAKKGTALEALLPRMGYGVQDIMFSKEL